MKKMAFSLLIVSLLVLVLPAAAQDASVIAYGETLTDELTDPQIFAFEGKTGDLALILFGASDFESTMSGGLAYVTLFDPEGTILGFRSSYSTADLFYQLPADGTYTFEIKADSGGEYNLSLSQVPLLEVGKLVEESINDTETHYYAYISEEAFTVSYSKVSGGFSPQVTVSTPVPGFEENELLNEEIGFLGGDRMSNGAFTIEPGEATLFLIIVSQSLFDFSFSESADYQLAVK
jgi:hypothetical protein